MWVDLFKNFRLSGIIIIWRTTINGLPEGVVLEVAFTSLDNYEHKRDDV